MASAQTIDKLLLLGKTDVMHQIYKMIGRLCNVDCAVLIIGERGCGKKTVARALHYYSHRAASPFYIISTDAIRDSTHEELLGIQGDHPADSTYYIPQWNTLPLLAHEQLLTIHSTRQYRCSHENHDRDHHFRFIAAIDHDFKRDLEDGKIPVDLYYDWNFLPLYIPPLRDHKPDIPLYANHFLEKLCAEKKVSRKELSPEATETMMAHDWPGNLDELKQVMESALSNCRGSYIRHEHLPRLKKPAQAEAEAIDKLAIFLNSKLTTYFQNSTPSASGNLYRLLLPHMEQSLFQYTLKKSNGNKNRAAEILGLHRNTLNKKLQKLGL
jgi:two-component system, NtrC family, nitrogen regulation response regulator GlnG